MLVQSKIEPRLFQRLVRNKLGKPIGDTPLPTKLHFPWLPKFNSQLRLCVNFLTIVMLNLTSRKQQVLPELQQNWMLHEHLLRLRFLHQSNRWHSFECLLFSLHRHIQLLKQKDIVRVAACKVIQNPGNFYMWNPESWALESAIHLKESNPEAKLIWQWIRNYSLWNPESKFVLDYLT